MGDDLDPTVPGRQVGRDFRRLVRRRIIDDQYANVDRLIEDALHALA
jgi:hypothetical protein